MIAACLLALLADAPVAAAAARQTGERIETPVRSIAADRRVVRLTYVRQYEPLPPSLGAPRRCDWIGYLRYRDREGPRRPSRADAVFVAMPGFLGGASEFDILARNVVRRAAAQGHHVELWALDRRANCLEDNRGVRVAARTGDYRLALDYYYRGREIRGRRFAGYKQSAEVPFLAKLGLAQTMRDEYDVIRRRIPRRLRRDKVLCGGHSLGGSLTAAFASWDFDGDPKTRRDAGYNQCAAYFGLDTSVSNDYFGGSSVLGATGDALYAVGVEGTRSGALPRYADSFPPFTPELFQVVAIAALAAYQQPGEARLLRELPHTSTIDSALRSLLSRDAVAFATGVPGPRDYRLTNEALLGALADDNSNPFPALQAGLGTFGGGPVTDKDFPTPNALRDLAPGFANLLSGTLIVPGTSATRLMIPARPSGPLYRWRDYDRVGAPGAPPQVDSVGRPFTSPDSEVTDVHEFARMLSRGPVNASEQYFPLRLQLDDIAFLSGGRSGELSAAVHEDGPRRRPYLELLAGEGGGNSLGRVPLEPGAKPRQRVILPGYGHLDMTTAARRQNGGGPERASSSLVRFALSVTR